MQRASKIALTLLIIILISACTASRSVAVTVPETDYWPTQGWQSAKPETQGVDSTLLAEMLEQISDNQTNLHSVLVIRNGTLVTEAYFHPYTSGTRVHVQSVTKSVIGALVGIAIEEGKIASADETLLSFFPDYLAANPSHDNDAIQVRHLLSMSSGLDCQEFSGGPAMEQSPDWVQFMLDLPLKTAPGKTFGYCNGSAHLLSAILQKSTGLSAREYANEKLFAPLGITPVELSDWGADPQGVSTGGYGLHLTAQELAKFALLYLHDGRWEGRQILPKGWVETSFQQAVQKEDGSGYGYLWTVYPADGHAAALGLGGQQIHIYPTKNLIVVVTAGLVAYAEAPEIESMLNDYILPSLKSEAALPDNPSAAERLRQAEIAAAHPVRPLPELPATALEISGKSYSFSENPLGWQTLVLTFTPGSKVGELTLNGSKPIQIGLDNIYRRSANELLGNIYLRARWVDERILVADYPYGFGSNRLGELGSSEFWFTFEGDEVDVQVRQLIFGGDPLQLNGKR